MAGIAARFPSNRRESARTPHIKRKNSFIGASASPWTPYLSRTATNPVILMPGHGAYVIVWIPIGGHHETHEAFHLQTSAGRGIRVDLRFRKRPWSGAAAQPDPGFFQRQAGQVHVPAELRLRRSAAR